MFFCAISGSPPTDPVVSAKSGTVYEKKLIVQYIEQNGTDPLSGEALTVEDLIDVKAKPQTLPPRAPTQTSIPSLLTSLQSEFDAIMLESLEIKKAYQASRQELANALYREDAAVRALARVIKERDEARTGLATVQATIGVSAPVPSAAPTTQDVEMQQTETSATVLPEQANSVVESTNEALSSVRKKRKPAAGHAKAANVKTFTQTSTVPSLHSTKPVGITALDLSADGNLALTGGADKTVQIYDFEANKTLSTLKGHTKPVHQVEFVNETAALSSSADKTVKLWNADGDAKWSVAGNMTGHKGDIVGFAVHPSKRYVAIGSADSTWSFRDLETRETVKTYTPLSNVEGSFHYSAFNMHPDGILYGAGTDDGKIRIWDVRDDANLAATLESTPSKPVTTLSFSENGYYLACGSKQDPTVNILDLRKLSILSSLQPMAEGGKVSQVAFDPSAQFLSVIGTELKVYANKSWDQLLAFDDNAGELTGCKWGPLGQKIVLAGMDRTLRVLSASA